nr:hypothetical protein [Tanacetum cinerariifolium]
MDEEFTTTAYPNIQENLKLPSEDLVILAEPSSSTGTLSSLQNLEKELSFTDQFFVEEQQEKEPGKTNAEAEVSKAVDEIVTDAVDWAMQAPLRACFSDLLTVDMKEILQQRCLKINLIRLMKITRSYASDAPGTLGALGSSQFPPLPPPPSTGTSGSAQQQGSKALSSSKSAASALQSMAWTISDTRYESAGVFRTQELSPTDSMIQYDSIPDECDEFPKLVLPTSEQDQACISRSRRVDWTNLKGDQVKVDINRPLPLGGSPGHVTIQTQFFFNKYLEYLRYDSKGSSPALLISKMKDASYPDFDLELLMPKQIHASPSRRKEVISNMRILSVVRIKAYSRYGDFEDLNMLFLQGHLDHLPSSDKQMLSTAVKLWTRNLVIQQRVEDF